MPPLKPALVLALSYALKMPVPCSLESSTHAPGGKEGDGDLMRPSGPPVRPWQSSRCVPFPGICWVAGGQLRKEALPGHTVSQTSVALHRPGQTGWLLCALTSGSPLVLPLAAVLQPPP